MSASASVHRSPQDYQVAVSGCGLTGGYLTLRYWLAPVPASVDASRRHGGDGSGIVIDSRQRTIQAARSAYRVVPEGDRLVGVIRFGPADWLHLGVIRVLFAPLAHTPGLHQRLCEVHLTVDADAIRTTTVRRRSARPLA